MLFLPTIYSLGQNDTSGISLQNLEKVLYETISSYQATYLSNPKDEESLASHIERQLISYEKKGVELEDWRKVVELLHFDTLKILSGSDLCIVFYQEKLVFGNFENPCNPSGSMSLLRSRIWHPTIFNVNGEIICQDESSIYTEFRAMLDSYLRQINLSGIDPEKMIAFEYCREVGLIVLCDRCLCEVSTQNIDILKRVMSEFFNRHNEISKMIFWIAY